MQTYLNMGRDILANGNRRGDRTGTGTVSVFGRQYRFDLAEGFPLLTSKKMFLRGIIEELLWFLNGDTNNKTLNDKGVTIWDEWALEDGRLGPVYGEQWRSWKGKVIDITDFQPRTMIEGGDKMLVTAVPVRQKHDQVTELMENLRKKPFSRRHVLSAWNVEDLPDETKSPQQNVLDGKMALAPCHCLFQFYVREMAFEDRLAVLAERFPELADEIKQSSNDDELEVLLTNKEIPKYKLDCQLYQRSADYCLGVPYNIASYALLTMMIAQCVNMVPGEFVHTFGDLHMYNNHVDIFVNEQLARSNDLYDLPTMKLNPEVKDIFGFKYEDFQLLDYKSHSKVNYEISV